MTNQQDPENHVQYRLGFGSGLSLEKKTAICHITPVEEGRENHGQPEPVAGKQKTEAREACKNRHLIDRDEDLHVSTFRQHSKQTPGGLESLCRIVP